MNFLAKHFFDYQSFINLPHTAVQMHKTPPSQAGTDPSAAWAPKDLHTAGKNQAAPAARANRNYHGDQRTGSHRHGRPSKLEFRNWGERHGELREEKIVPHKDHWMESLEGGGGGGLSSRRASLDGALLLGHHPPPHDHFPSEYFPRAAALKMQRQQYSSLDAPRMPSSSSGGVPIRLLVILTVSPHLDFITVTVKAARGFPPMATAKDPLVQLRLFDGSRLIDERGPQTATAATSRTSDLPAIQVHPAPMDSSVAGMGQEERPLGRSFLLKAPTPLRLPFCQMAITLYSAASSSAKPVPLGTCLLGPSGTVSRGNSHWRQMIKKMGVSTAMWHELGGQPPINKQPTTTRGGGGEGGGRSKGGGGGGEKEVKGEKAGSLETKGPKDHGSPRARAALCGGGETATGSVK